jgi:hypothetical protein
MRRWLPLVLLLCATPAIAQTRWIVGNTLIDVPPGMVLADAGKGYGKGHGRGGGAAPAPSPAPSSSSQGPSSSFGGESRGESSYTYQQAQPYQPPSYPPQVAQYPAPVTSGDCPACGTTITVPVQIQLRTSLQALAPQAQPQAAAPPPCPAGCVFPALQQAPCPRP